MDAKQLDELVPEMIRLDKALLSRLKVSIQTLKRMALRGTFPQILHPHRGCYLVREVEFAAWVSGQWIDPDKMKLINRNFARIFNRPAREGATSRQHSASASSDC